MNYRNAPRPRGCPNCGSNSIRTNLDRQPEACFDCGWLNNQ